VVQLTPGDFYLTVRILGDMHSGNAFSFGIGIAMKPSYGDGFGKEGGTVGLFQNCEAASTDLALFTNSLEQQGNAPETRTTWRIEVGMSVSLHLDFRGNPDGPGLATFWINQDVVGQARVPGGGVITVAGCTLNTGGHVAIIPAGAEGTAFAGVVTSALHAAAPKEPEATSWACPQCTLECAVAYAICPACGAARDGAAATAKSNVVEEPLPDVPPEPTMTLKCKLYVWVETTAAGPVPWKELCLGDAIPRYSNGGPVLEVEARAGKAAGSTCYRHAIARGVNTLEGPAPNLVCWTAVDESGVSSREPRRYLAKFETAGYAKVFQQEYRRLQCAQ
jgi:hypothetical protein